MSYKLRDCAGHANFKSLKSFTLNCPECGKEAEIFSDEFDKEHTCKSCGVKIDFSKCELKADT